MATGGKLVIGGLVLVAAAAYLAFLGTSGSWQYYLTVDECLADAERLEGARLRVSGKVAADSLMIDTQRNEARFALEGTTDQLQAVCSGPFPDGFAEGADVVVEGQLDGDRVLRGHKLLAQCATKYRSRRTAGKPKDH